MKNDAARGVFIDALSLRNVATTLAKAEMRSSKGSVRVH